MTRAASSACQRGIGARPRTARGDTGRVLAGASRALALATLLAAPWGLARACQACFGAEETPLLDGARLGVWVLLAVTLGIQAAFAAFFLSLRRRLKRAARAEIDAEWSEFQRAAR